MQETTTPSAGRAPETLAVAEPLPVLPPTAAFVEILVLLVLPAAADYFLPWFPSLTEMQPHFFWLPVLLLSLQYGTVSGLLAAGVAIALTFALGTPEQEVGENHFSFLLRIWAQPVLWLATALILGQFRMRQIEKKQQLARAVAELTSQRSAIADYATNLRGRCEMLERELATRRTPPVSTLLSQLDRLDRSAPEAIAALGDVLATAFGAASISLYRADGQGLHRLARFGSQARDAMAPELIAADHPVLEAVLRRGMRLSAIDPQDELVLGGLGLVAAPVPDAAPARTASGMLLIEHLPTCEFDACTAGRLAAIARNLTPLMQPDGVAQRRSTTDAGAAIAPMRGTERIRLWRAVRHANRAARPATRHKGR